ncbi:hypothetical protein SALBM311S_08288 [Streptomyces alboniger]
MAHPEGIISACAVKCLGGTIQGKLWPKDDEERQRAIDAGHDLDRVLTTDDLVSGENVFFVATGITDGELLRGVRYRSETATTDSIVMRSKSGTVRRIDSEHRLADCGPTARSTSTGRSRPEKQVPKQVPGRASSSEFAGERKREASRCGGAPLFSCACQPAAAMRSPALAAFFSSRSRRRRRARTTRRSAAVGRPRRRRAPVAGARARDTRP